MQHHHNHHNHQKQFHQIQLIRQKNAMADKKTPESIPERVAAPVRLARPILASSQNHPVVLPLECSNCMALDSLSWFRKTDPEEASLASNSLALDSGDSPSSLSLSSSPSSSPPSTEYRVVYPFCMQYQLFHGKYRPMPSYRINILKRDPWSIQKWRFKRFSSKGGKMLNPSRLLIE